MKSIPVTQFLYPNGEERAQVCDVSEDVAGLGYRPLAVSGTTVRSSLFSRWPKPKRTGSDLWK
jgi:hypothetical protein